mgnify:CR=1 FL=1
MPVKIKGTLRCVTIRVFFRAEDGIRDRDVTGVQTCALPIWKKEIRQKIHNSKIKKHPTRVFFFVV